MRSETLLWALAVATATLAHPMEEKREQEGRLEKRIAPAVAVGLAGSVISLFNRGGKKRKPEDPKVARTGFDANSCFRNEVTGEINTIEGCQRCCGARASAELPAICYQNCRTIPLIVAAPAPAPAPAPATDPNAPASPPADPNAAASSAAAPATPNTGTTGAQAQPAPVQNPPLAPPQSQPLRYAYVHGDPVLRPMANPVDPNPPVQNVAGMTNYVNVLPGATYPQNPSAQTNPYPQGQTNPSAQTYTYPQGGSGSGVGMDPSLYPGGASQGSGTGMDPSLYPGGASQGSGTGMDPSLYPGGASQGSGAQPWPDARQQAAGTGVYPYPDEPVMDQKQQVSSSSGTWQQGGAPQSGNQPYPGYYPPSGNQQSSGYYPQNNYGQNTGSGLPRDSNSQSSFPGGSSTPYYQNVGQFVQGNPSGDFPQPGDQHGQGSQADARSASPSDYPYPKSPNSAQNPGSAAPSGSPQQQQFNYQNAADFSGSEDPSAYQPNPYGYDQNQPNKDQQPGMGANYGATTGEGDSAQPYDDGSGYHDYRLGPGGESNNPSSQQSGYPQLSVDGYEEGNGTVPALPPPPPAPTPLNGTAYGGSVDASYGGYPGAPLDPTRTRPLSQQEAAGASAAAHERSAAAVAVAAQDSAVASAAAASQAATVAKQAADAAASASQAATLAETHKAAQAQANADDTELHQMRACATRMSAKKLKFDEKGCKKCCDTEVTYLPKRPNGVVYDVHTCYVGCRESKETIG